MSHRNSHLNHYGQKHGNVKFTKIIVSDTRYQQLQTKKPVEDLTTPLIEKILSDNDYFLQDRYIIPNEKDEILQLLNSIIDSNNSDVIILSGGTGIGPRDLTIETLQPQLEKEMPGFGELFRYLSFEVIGAAAMLSRATAGIIKNKVIFILPGNPNAVEIALNKLILPEIDHMLNMLGV